MLAAHLVPGYLAARAAKSGWPAAWGWRRRAALWAVALGSTALPDIDVAYNALFRGFFNHSTLWTHSLLPHAALALIWLGLRLGRIWRFGQALIGLAAAGGLSHLFLDAISHGTPLLYPFSLDPIGGGPERVIRGGVRAYLTDPIILFELIALGFAAWLAVADAGWPARVVRRWRLGIVGGCAVACGMFLWRLPYLQRWSGFF
ncbi:MAG TPA: metal-dependent hydrolase [Herpetosiphonaceae bacterium]